jgi:hypothetical protein
VYHQVTYSAVPCMCLFCLSCGNSA